MKALRVLAVLFVVGLAHQVAAQFQPPSATSSTGSAAQAIGFLDAGTIRVTGEIDLDPNAATDAVLLPATIALAFRDHSGVGRWNLWDNPSALGNIDALTLSRNGGSTPYFFWDFNTGYAVSRYGMAIASANDGSGQRLVPVLGPNDGGVSLPEACLHGNEVESSGSVAVTYVPAFSVAPDCVCNHRDVTNSNDCTVHAGPTTTGMTLAVASGGSDRVMWICCGPR